MLPDSEHDSNEEIAQDNVDTAASVADEKESTPVFAPAAFSAPTPATADSDTPDSTALSLYLVTLFSGASILCSASYLVWNVIDYFTKPAPEFSFFDLSSFTIYVLIYLVLFATLYVLASLRLDGRIKRAGSFERPLRTVSAIWRALLVVWGVGAIAGLLYSPLSAAANGDASSVATDVISSIIGLVLIGLLFWRDLFVPKMRSGIVALGVIGGLVLVIAGANIYANFNPKQPKENTYDYSSSMYDY